jgi:ABC-type cobalamin/Fe3+-siderophores transport system ATPase subunit
MGNSEIVPFSEIVTSKIDLNQAVVQGQEMTDTLKKMGIKEATFDSGAYYKHDHESQTTTLAADGILMRQSPHTTTVIFRNEGSTEQQALEELNTGSLTQKTLGAFSGVSQQRASELLQIEKE